jgi:hypothetical protein
MKYWIVFFVSAVPLLVLTILTFTGEGSGVAASHQPLAEETLSAARLVIESQSAVGQQNKTAGEQLASADLLGGDSSLAEPPKWLASTADAWQRFVTDRMLAIQISAVDQKSPEKELADLQQIVTKINENDDLTNRAGGLLQLLNRRIEPLKADLGQRASDERTAQMQRNIDQALAAKKYDECIKACDTVLALLLEDPSTGVDGAKIEQTKKRATYLLAWQTVSQRGADTTDQSQLARVTAFLQQHAAPPSKAEKTVDAAAHKLKTSLESRAKVSAATLEANNKLVVLEQNPPSNLDRLAKQCQLVAREVVASMDAAGVADARKRFDRVIRNQLAKGLRDAKVQEHPEMQEAETKDGMILRGFFLPFGGKFFRHYDKHKSFKARNSSWKKVVPRDLAVQPRPAMLLRQAKQYNDYVAKLREDVNSKSGWQGMLALAKQLDKQQATYRSRKGAGSVGYSFGRLASPAGSVLSYFDRLSVFMLK